MGDMIIALIELIHINPQRLDMIITLIKLILINPEGVTLL